MKVLLTGAAGFIGTATATALRGVGHEVVPVDALVPQAHARPVTEPEGVHVLDVRQARDWSGLLSGVDVVCHLAAMVGAGVTVCDLPLYAAHNDLGTAALLAAMSESGVSRFVQASSMVVYGEGRYRCPAHGDQSPAPRRVEHLDAGLFDNGCPLCGRLLGWEAVTEDAVLDPRSSYASSKVAQEHYAAAWARQAGASAISLRYHNVYGPGMPRDTPYSGVAAIFRSAMEAGRAPLVFEDGLQMRDFVHVEDVARANVAAVEAVLGRHRGSHTAYNVCSGQPVTILDVARMVTAAAPGSPLPVVSGDYRLGDVRHVVASPARASAELGFTARISPEIGLARFARDPLRA
ncbi:NAD(P)-dependent oxidoreductase [Phycicoccus sp. Soil748]|uniref:NAD-dependent epimerase/dehydratase family protein n=1 Tax=Phycicoccus sp. Soil748 TaxID=1736397 RepID=UPI000702F4E0|nr:NAD-dependent epimerase/dehydratase family protein [Phycicoccus sp. Soil748]KRE52480.1 NAD-dependent dehydratase [Phycicoccus sp. Soil748]